MNTNYTTDTTEDYTIISLSPMQIDLSISYQQSLKDEQKRIFYDAPLLIDVRRRQPEDTI